MKKDFIPKAILALTFGSSYERESYNNELAKAVQKAKSNFKFNGIILVQAEIGKCLSSYGFKSFKSFGSLDNSKRFIFPEKTTSEILLLMNKELTKKKISKDILFIAHPKHIKRVIKEANKIGLSGQAFEVKESYYKKDPQLWVRSQRVFKIREFLANLIS